ncbi:hypothetical protein K8352_08720 [Flavobacteriaceae bacterium F89]|uniref:Uncharacterized protein n=1 Tax=Cerina litoralis TaxID=2874477 RepID=A0AAE3JND4_9FLAO|nr:hypothetical protein [Cerina litoralis]MCG2460830.1 hypothetical protein [Cerina litoralis]
MQNITLISTIHKKIGKCTADELCEILEEVSPEVVFLEALDNTYSNYDKTMFSTFGLYHGKLEIEAIQKYSNHTSVEYVPVLDNGLPDLFDEKYKGVLENNQLQQMLDEFNLLAKSKGFQFLNSQLCLDLHQKMRTFEDHLLRNTQLNATVIADINAYENSMMQNIYSYCIINRFEKAVFLCGSAHRESLIEKIRHFQEKENMEINWVVYGD